MKRKYRNWGQGEEKIFGHNQVYLGTTDWGEQAWKERKVFLTWGTSWPGREVSDTKPNLTQGQAQAHNINA